MRDVYTLDDLSSRDLLDADESMPAKLAVIGWPVAHSASPRMHQPALDSVNAGIRYVRIEVPPGRVAEAFDAMRALGFIGCNITVPHKFEALEACGDVHPEASSLGAVNTVRFDPEVTRGFNTDGPGFVRAIAEVFEVPLSTLKIAVLGAGGGAGQAIAAQCSLQGAERVVLVNRSIEKLGPLADRLRALGPVSEIITASFTDPMLAEICLECDLIVNTSSLGLKAGDHSILPESCLKPGHLVYDTIYQPPVTPLLELADRIGCRTANGRSLLIHQGVLAFQHWFPQTDPLHVMREALG
jgi:shikimate dehydrogenase